MPFPTPDELARIPDWLESHLEKIIREAWPEPAYLWNCDIERDYRPAVSFVDLVTFLNSKGWQIEQLSSWNPMDGNARWRITQLNQRDDDESR